MNTPDDIRWTTDPGAPRLSRPCPLCGSMGPHAQVLRVPSMAPPHGILTFLHCDGCGSGLYDPPDIADFSDLGENSDDFWRYYIEVGGGIWETIWPVLAERRAGRRTLLDVGCGFGFAVDYWQRIRKGESVGVELASYGQTGARMLGITVYDKLLQDIEELKGRRFDVVYASEVIEHVPDPAALVALLAQYVADDGVLVLTTPSAEYVRPENHSPTLHAALAPGFHGFLLSAQAFGDAVRANGFTHVDVRQFSERQMLWASRAPISVDTAPGDLFPDYKAYLESRVSQVDHASPVWQGFAYRSLKVSVNEGRYAEAGALGNRLLDAVAETFGAHVRDPDAVIARLRTCKELADVGEQMPYFMPSLFFYLGAAALYAERDVALAERMFRGAIGSTLEACRIGSIFFLDSVALYWPAHMALADMAFLRGDFAAGARIFADMAASGGMCTQQNAYAIAGPDIAEVRVPSTIEQLSAHGQIAAAQTVFDGYASYLRRRYGDAMLDATAVDQALANGATPVPLDPLMAPCFAAVARHRELGNREDVIAELAAVADVATRWSAHPRYGPRMQEHAKRVRWLLPAPAPAKSAAWSFEMNYTTGKGGPRS